MAFESYRLTDTHTYIHTDKQMPPRLHVYTVPRRFVGGQQMERMLIPHVENSTIDVTITFSVLVGSQKMDSWASMV